VLRLAVLRLAVLRLAVLRWASIGPAMRRRGSQSPRYCVPARCLAGTR
jgi:hypothetical protein